ncbi:hypothetical protein MiSe_72120 [Microseira wollei NIES-4236]|uniref:Uncharacterized protein n=1 Tax=Microseira wollei NIES-4236 TaxID=2530354 RepID=A0AAV3XKE5_9CYAN|nr:hypothetical protein MiSe_72120 [Microseira wollei NIES-4236]
MYSPMVLYQKPPYNGGAFLPFFWSKNIEKYSMFFFFGSYPNLGNGTAFLRLLLGSIKPRLPCLYWALFPQEIVTWENLPQLKYLLTCLRLR